MIHFFLSYFSQEKRLKMKEKKRLERQGEEVSFFFSLAIQISIFPSGHLGRKRRKTLRSMVKMKTTYKVS